MFYAIVKWQAYFNSMSLLTVIKLFHIINAAQMTLFYTPFYNRNNCSNFSSDLLYFIISFTISRVTISTVFFQQYEIFSFARVFCH